MKRKFAVSLMICMTFTGVFFSGCEKMDLATTNDRLDGTEKQVSYRTDTQKKFSVETAYENGLLTQTDLAYAMYYARGKVYTCTKSDWKKGETEKTEALDWAPTEECSAFNEQVELDIKRDYYDSLFTKMHYKGDLSFEEFTENLSFRFVGSYNGTFVITDVKTIYWDYPTDVPPPIYLAGFVWDGGYATDLFVFRYE